MLVEYLAPQAKNEGNMIVTKFKVKNVSKGPIGGFKVDEYWYNAKGDAVSGSPTFRVQKPLMPGDVVEVVLRSPRVAGMTRNSYIFGHANGYEGACVHGGRNGESFLDARLTASASADRRDQRRPGYARRVRSPHSTSRRSTTLSLQPR